MCGSFITQDVFCSQTKRCRFRLSLSSVEEFQLSLVPSVLFHSAIFILKTFCFLFEAPFSTSKLLLLYCQTLHLNCLRALLSLQSALRWKLLKNLFLIHKNMRPEVHMEKNLYLGSGANRFCFPTMRLIILKFSIKFYVAQ